MRLLIGRSPRRTFIRACCLAVVSFVVFWYILIPFRVEGSSMEPAYRHRQINFINRFAYRTRDPQRGDVVGIQLAGRRVMYLKRLIGLPGERIAIHGGVVLINGEPLEEPYLKLQPARWMVPEVDLGPDEYFYIGDNRSMSQHQHQFDRITRDRIAGKVLF
ncbi:MAG: signal peptidase I [Verrucomicrobiota bacterium]|jgi:signal peptidase I